MIKIFLIIKFNLASKCIVHLCTFVLQCVLHIYNIIGYKYSGDVRSYCIN